MALEHFAIQAERLPLLVHCMDGTLTTGLAIMCLRKLQLISFEYAAAEFLRFTRLNKANQ